MPEFNQLDLGQVYSTGEAIKGQRTNNALRQQQTQRGNALMAREQQIAQQQDQDRARQQLAPIFQAINRSAEPRMAFTRLESQIRPLLDQAGLDNTQFTVTAQDDPEQLRQQFGEWAEAFGSLSQSGRRLHSVAVDESGETYGIGSDFSVQPLGITQQRFAQRPIEGAGGTLAFDPSTGSAQNVIPGTEAGAMREREVADVTATTTAEARTRGLEGMLSEQINDGYAGADQIPVLSRAINLIDEGIKTGGFANLQLWATDTLGITGADEGELSANLGKAVLSQLRATFGAQFTQQEGERLADIEAGFGRSAAVNRRLLAQARAIARRAARRGITAARRADRADDARLIEEAMNMDLTPGPAGSEQDVAPDMSQYTEQQLHEIINRASE